MVRALAAAVALGVLTPSVAVATHHVSAGASTRAAPTTTTAPAIIAPTGLTPEVLDVAVEGGKREVRVYREHRAVVGFSMGGYGAANLASRHPDRFGQMVSIEGYFNTDDPSGMFGGDPAAIAANSPDQQAAALAEARVMVLDGTEDDEPACIGEAARYDKILDAAGVDHDTGFGPGAHSWDFVRAQAPTWTGFLDAGWPEHAPAGTATPA